MKLVCTGCGGRYQIDDAIVRGKLVRLRCKRCANVLEVRGPSDGSRVSRVVRAGPPGPPPRRDAAPEAPRAAVPEPPRAAAPETAPSEWFLSVEGRLRGPMSPAELRQRVRRREAGPGDLVWTSGFESWRPIAVVPEIRAALDEPAPPPRHRPPALPAVRPGGSVLRLLPSSERAGPAAAPAPALAPDAPPLAPTAPQPQQAIPVVVAARWPLAVALLGGISLALALALVMVLREQQRPSYLEGERPVTARTQLHVGPPEVEVHPSLQPPTSQEATPSSLPVTTTLPAVEVRGRRGAPTPPTVTATPEPRERELRDLKTMLAAQILRHNRASLAACDRLAERRGETLRPGSRAEFRVRVEEDGRASIQVSGQGLSAATLTCYRSVASEWKLPQIGEAYATVFAHVH